MFFLGKAHVLHLNLVLFQHLKFVIRHPECPKKKYEERDECEKILGGKWWDKTFEDISTILHIHG
jgi:hypothetical protein